MERILVIAEKIFINLYRPGLEDYSKTHDDLTIDIYCLDVPKEELSTVDRLRYKLDIGGFRKKYYDAKRNELSELVKEYDTILFINLFYGDNEYFIKGEFKKSILNKECKLYFVDSVKSMPSKIDFWECFSDVYSFEFSDISYLKEKFNVKATYIPIGTNYNLYKTNEYKEYEYDVCFVGIATPNRLEYLEAIAKLCNSKGYRLFVGGHFWHNSNQLNYETGRIKFKNKYKNLYKYVKNKFIQPNELADFYKRSKICLNINVAYHKSFNPRNFDILYSRRLLISDEQNLEGIDIKANEDFVMCNNVQDMVEKIDYYLQNMEKTNDIIERGYCKVASKYLYKNTLDAILERRE